MEKWRYIKEWDKLVTPEYGLAVDDTLPYSVAEKDSPPILHLYRFEPSAIVGKYQDIRAALKIDRCKELGIHYNRRSTGGGTVIMGPKAVALGFGISLKHPAMQGGIKGIFNTMSQILIRTLADFGIKGSFRPKNDLEVNGKKIAGLSASADVDDAILFHTSLLIDFDINLMLEIMNTPVEKIYDKGYSCFSERMTTMEKEIGEKIDVEVVMESLKKSFEKQFGVVFEEDELSDWEKQKVKWFDAKRYRDEKWIFSKRHPKYKMGEGLLKTPGGLLQVYISLAGGVIENLMITGDFFSTGEDINRLESNLKYTMVNRENIENSLRQIWKDDIIYGVDIPTLTTAILKASENCV
ncbi:MAG: hypothetical protein D6734_06665 [Candidatus Schekmanbacteria bacterium]|nr:MAG: hypothetical protein D6734_06665 [Candidatus Schekmanbacteria bacterium]